MEITKLSQLDFSKSYNYLDYLSWKFQERVELLRGKIFEMSPAPNTRHQIISTDLVFAFSKHLENANCRVFHAPFDVRLFRKLHDEDSQTVVQPDICIICDQSKVDQKGCNGAPELVVEILSPGNSKKEMKNKFELYEQAGVLEYWIIDPDKEMVLQYILKENKFATYRPLVSEDTIESIVILGFKIELSSIFS